MRADHAWLALLIRGKVAHGRKGPWYQLLREGGQGGLGPAHPAPTLSMLFFVYHLILQHSWLHLLRWR